MVALRRALCGPTTALESPPGIADGPGVLGLASLGLARKSHAWRDKQTALEPLEPLVSEGVTTGFTRTVSGTASCARRSEGGTSITAPRQLADRSAESISALNRSGSSFSASPPRPGEGGRPQLSAGCQRQPDAGTAYTAGEGIGSSPGAYDGRNRMDLGRPALGACSPRQAAFPQHTGAFRGLRVLDIHRRSLSRRSELAWSLASPASTAPGGRKTHPSIASSSSTSRSSCASTMSASPAAMARCGRSSSASCELSRTAVSLNGASPAANASSAGPAS